MKNKIYTRNELIEIMHRDLLTKGKLYDKIFLHYLNMNELDFINQFEKDFSFKLLRIIKNRYCLI